MNESESIPFKGRLSPQDFRAIQAVAMRPLTWMFMGALAFFIVTLVVGGYVPWSGRDVLDLTLHWVYVPILLLFFWWARRFTFRRLWTRNKFLRQSFSGTVSEVGIHQRSDLSQSNYPWDMLHKARLSDGLVLVYASPAQTIAFPRSFIASDADWSRFRALIERKLYRSRR